MSQGTLFTKVTNIVYQAVKQKEQSKLKRQKDKTIT